MKFLALLLVQSRRTLDNLIQLYLCVPKSYAAMISMTARLIESIHKHKTNKKPTFAPCQYTFRGNDFLSGLISFTAHGGHKSESVFVQPERGHTD